MKLADWIAINGYSDERMAKLVGVSPGFINRLKHGKRRPGVETLASIKRVTKGACSGEEFYPSLRKA